VDLLEYTHTAETPEVFLRERGTLFARFDQATQDSGNISYGVRIDGQRYFVKTAGAPYEPAFLNHDERVYWLRNATRLAAALQDPVLPPLLNAIESPHGPLLIYPWIDGESVRTTAEQRDDPSSSFQRFRRLPLAQLVDALTAIFRVHVALAERGWIANDFYDGAMLYDFDRAQLHLIDLDLYRSAPFTNDMGRLFGSTRFMAPEEFERGARIDERTTVFTMGRCIQLFVDPTSDIRRALHDVAERACQPQPSERWPHMADFYAAWLGATSGLAHSANTD
jgi:serine/threonine-protein kinase